MDRALGSAVGDALGSAVVSNSPLSGGDINEALRVTLADGRRVFVKYNPAAPRSMFPAEAKGLDWLREARTLRVPEVLAVSDERGAGPSFLALELIERAPFCRDFDDRLGRGLAGLHRFGAPGFGLHHDNFIGSLPQANEPLATWAAFYRERRLMPQVRRGVDRGRIGPALMRAFDRLYAVLDELVPPPTFAARLHGDLWGGNLHVDEQGMPCLIDPAAYGGDREVDLAMMRLFGGFGPRVFAAYEEAWPLPAGHERRVPLYQLYPLLVHVNLFGGGYVGSVERAMSDLLS
jgi:fructosamine-3-kinase